MGEAAIKYMCGLSANWNFWGSCIPSGESMRPADCGVNYFCGKVATIRLWNSI